MGPFTMPRTALVAAIVISVTAFAGTDADLAAVAARGPGARRHLTASLEPRAETPAVEPRAATRAVEPRAATVAVGRAECNAGTFCAPEGIVRGVFRVAGSGSGCNAEWVWGDGPRPNIRTSTTKRSSATTTACGPISTTRN